MSAAELVITGTGAVCAPGAGGGRVAAEFARELTLNEARRLDRLSQLFVVAARQAAAQASFGDTPEAGRAVVAGTGVGCLEKTESQLHGMLRDGAGFADPLSFPDSMGNAPAAHVAIATGARGISLTLMEREISAESALVVAARLLRSGTAAAVLVVAGDAWSAGLETVVARLAPWLVLGEGAGALVLETAESARRRNGSGICDSRKLGCRELPPGADISTYATEHFHHAAIWGLTRRVQFA